MVQTTWGVYLVVPLCRVVRADLFLPCLTLCQVEKILCQIIQFAEQRQSYVQILGLRVGVDTHE